MGADLLPASGPVFDHALALAQKYGAELLIAHAESIPNSIGFLPSSSYDEWETLAKDEAIQQIAVLKERARRDGVHCHALVLKGTPEDALIEAASRLKADLIVVGGHCRRGLTRLLMGCRAASLVARAPCSILVVRLPQD